MDAFPYYLVGVRKGRVGFNKGTICSVKMLGRYFSSALPWKTCLPFLRQDSLNFAYITRANMFNMFVIKISFISRREYKQMYKVKVMNPIS